MKIGMFSPTKLQKDPPILAKLDPLPGSSVGGVAFKWPIHLSYGLSYKSLVSMGMRSTPAYVVVLLKHYLIRSRVACRK